MKITRRQFLKILGVGGAAIVAPKTLLAIPADKTSFVQFVTPEQPAGTYLFSYFAKQGSEGPWQRFVHEIELDNKQKPLCRVYLKDGEVIFGAQLEPTNLTGRNYTTGEYILHNAVSERDHNTPHFGSQFVFHK